MMLQSNVFRWICKLATEKCNDHYQNLSRNYIKKLKNRQKLKHVEQFHSPLTEAKNNRLLSIGSILQSIGSKNSAVFFWWDNVKIINWHQK